MKKITYLTATWNRENLLPNLYKSLVNQTNKDFIWMIVDDGSTDNTKSLIKTWIDEDKIEIKYYHKKNGGKHTALNIGNSKCKTEFICYVDSDDFLTNDCTQILYSKFDKCKKDNIVGIVGRRATYKGAPFNENWCNEEQLVNFSELSSKFGYSQDTILVFKTSIVNQFSFPVFKDEKFVTESVLYNQFLYNYKLLAIKELVYLSEYQEAGYSNQGLKLFLKNPQGYAFALKQNAYYFYHNQKDSKNALYYLANYYAWLKVMKPDKVKDYKLPIWMDLLSRLAKIKFIKYYKQEKAKHENRDKN